LGERIRVLICHDCNRVNPDDADECVECGGRDFSYLAPVAYNDIEQYKDNPIEEK